MQYLIVILFAYAGFACHIIVGNNLIWKIDSALFSTGFVFLGYRLWKKLCYFKVPFHFSGMLLCFTINILGCLGELVTHKDIFILSINSNVYISVISNYGLAITGSLFVMELVKWMNEKRNSDKICMRLGGESLDGIF